MQWLRRVKHPCCQEGSGMVMMMRTISGSGLAWVMWHVAVAITTSVLGCTTSWTCARASAALL